MAPLLRPVQLENLKSGAKVTIFAGRSNTRTIVYDDAFENLLAHFSTYCKERFEKNAYAINIPFGNSKTIEYIYRWMLAGGTDDAEMPKEGVTALREHAIFLGIQPLLE